MSAERSEVWVNIGYRLSAFGFLACDEPRVAGNFAFKDQWLALLWVRDNIEQFGGTIFHLCSWIYAHSRFWCAQATQAIFRSPVYLQVRRVGIALEAQR